MMRGLGKYPLTDSLTMYRGYDVRITQFPEFQKILRATHFQPLTSAVAMVRKLKIFEIPGDEPPRIGGESKLSVFNNGMGVLIMIIRMYLFKWFGSKKTEVKLSSELQ
jgi:hypothetical protein